MARCKEQELEVTQLVEDKIQEAVEFLSNKSLKEAITLAQRINNNQFFGSPVITVSSNTTSREDGIPEVSFSQEAKLEAINAKIVKDNELQLDERVQELIAGNNYFFDDLPAQSEIYDEFDYSSVISNKMLLKEKLEKQRDLLKNKGKSKEQLEQIEYLNETIRKLYIDITKLQRGEESLDHYLKSVEKDINNVEELLKNPTLDNIQAINNYLEVLSLLTDEGPGGFLKEPLSDIKDKESEIWQKLADVHSKIGILKSETDTKIKLIIKDTIKFHLEQKEENSNWDQEQLENEVERLYENQITESIGKMSWLKSQVTMLDDQEERNVLVSVLYKVYTDALATNNNKEKRKQLSNIKDKTLRELKRLGKTTGSGFNKRPDQSVFLRKSETSHQLIGKFSENWVNFKRKAESDQSKISKILYKGDKSQQEIKDIQKQFDTLNDNVDFLDVTRVPEIIEDGDFSHYSSSFMSKEDANTYRKELVSKIGEREYNKLVEQQKQNIYSYQIFKSVREARLRDKHDLTSEQNIQDNIPEKEWNSHLHFLYSKSPFIFSENYRNKGNNTITKPYYVSGKKYLSENTPADLEFISYSPKKPEHFDSNFTEIENNKVLNEAWNYMADLVEYNNNNGFNQNPDNLTEYSLASQEKRVKSFPLRMLGLLSRKTLDTIHNALTVDRYKNPDKEYNVAGQISNVDQEIERLYNAMIKKYREPSNDTKSEVLAQAKKVVMARQDTDLIDNILASTEITETFKAKREIENKVNFIRKHIEEQTDRKRYKDLVNFFADKELYQINNRANFNRVGKGFNFSDLKGAAWTRFYTQKEREVRDASKESLKALKQHLKEATTQEEKNSINREIKAIEDFLDSGGKVVTPGSLIEGWVIKLSRVAAFSLNFSAQITNKAIASLNAWEVDGRLGFWQPGVYHDAMSFSRKWKGALGNKETKEQIKVGELLLQRLQLFQNSSNEIFKLEKSRAATTLGAILENPMNFVSEVEKTIQRPQIFALISEIKMKDKESNEVPMFDPKARSFPAFKTVDGNLELREEFDTPENRETFLTNTSQEYANLFGDGGRIPKAIAYINGDYRNTSTYLFEKNTLTAIMMLFKRWSVMTVSKKFGVLKRLGENEHSGLGNTALALKAGAYSFATGALFGPVGMASSLALYTTYHGYKSVRREMKDDVGFIKAAQRALVNARIVPTRAGFERNIRLSLATSAQALSMVIDPLTKKQYINSEHIKRIIKVKDKKKDGEEFTPEEIREIKEDIYFLTTSVAATLKFLALRYLVMMALYPDGEEEEEYKEKVKEGQKFWTRVASDPDTAMYYTLENMLSGFIDDSNMLVNLEGLQRMGDLQGDKYGTYVKDIEKMIKGDGDLKSGPNQGENALKVHLLRYNTPSVLKDGVSLGFGSKSRRDFDTRNFIDQVKRPEIEKINEARKEAYRAEKKEMMESKKLAKMPKKARKKYVNSFLAKKYPVIKDIHMDKKGKVRKVYRPLYKHYWDDSR